MLNNLTSTLNVSVLMMAMGIWILLMFWGLFHQRRLSASSLTLAHLILLVVYLDFYTPLLLELGAATRNMLVSLGWYDHRKPVQLTVLIFGGIVWLGILGQLIHGRNRRPWPQTISFLNLSLLAVIMLVSQWSYHDTDSFMRFQVAQHSLEQLMTFALITGLSLSSTLQMLTQRRL